VTSCLWCDSNRQKGEAFLSDSDEAADMQDSATNHEKSGGHPVIATIIAAFFSLIGVFSGDRVSLTADGLAGRIGYIAGGAGGCALLWGIAYAITIKRASRGWKIGSLIVLLMLGALGSLVRLGTQNLAVRADADATARQLAEAMKQGDNPQPLATGPDAGPLMRMSARTTNMILANAKAFNADADASGAVAILSLRGLTKQSPVLDHCDRIAGLAGRAASIGANFPKYVAAARAEGDAAIAAGEIGRPAVDGFISGLDGTHPKYERQWALLGQTATDGAALCRVLARRHWENGAAGQVLFSNPGDLREANLILGRIQKADREIAAMRQAEAEATRHELDTMRAH
jgi:hypothetical protein